MIHNFAKKKKYLKEFKLRIIILRFAPGIIYSLLVKREQKK